VTKGASLTRALMQTEIARVVPLFPAYRAVVRTEILLRYVFSGARPLLPEGWGFAPNTFCRLFALFVASPVNPQAVVDIVHEEFDIWMRPGADRILRKQTATLVMMTAMMYGRIFPLP
jgi:hypothetical protein